MLARSTAWRQGLGRAWTKATSISMHAALADQQVGRLDVAVGQPGVPQLADDAEPVVDHLLVDLGLAELGGAGEELGDQQVLPLGGQLHEPERGRAGKAGPMHQRQRVVLLLDQAADGVERLLVLQPAVQQLPAQLVPAVRAQVAEGVQLAEELGRGIAGHGDPQGGGAGRAGEAERLDLGDLQPELVLEPAPDGLAAGPADVQVGAAAPPVADREDLVGREPAVGQQRDGDPEGRPDDHVGGAVGAKGHPAEGGQRDQRRHHPLAGVAPAALGHQRVQDRDQPDGEEGDVQGRHGPAAPALMDLGPERPRPLGDGAEDGQADVGQQVDQQQPDDQVPEPAKDQQRDDQPVGDAVQHPPGADGGQPAHHRLEAGQVHPAQPADHGGVEDGHVDGEAPQAAREDPDGRHDQHQRDHQPPDPAGLEVVGQRRRLPGRPPAQRPCRGVGMGPGGPGGPFGWRVHQALPQTSLARHQASQAEGPSALPRPVVKAPGRLSR